MKIQHHKLTKDYFLSLAPFNFLVSGVCAGGARKPNFAEYVEPAEQRCEQWRRIVRSRASQRNCFVFINQQSYLNWIERFAPART